MGNKTTLFHYASVTAINPAHPGLQDIRLDDSANDRSPTMEPRPIRFRNIVHEILFVIVCSFAGATFIFLQRCLIVIMDPLQTELRMSPSELSWTVAGPGLSAGALFLLMTFLVGCFRRISRGYILAGSLCCTVSWSASARLRWTGYFSTS